MTEADLLQKMRKDVEKAGSMRKYAIKVGVTVAYISDILAGKRHPGPSIAKHYGLSVERTFVRTFR